MKGIITFSIIGCLFIATLSAASIHRNAVSRQIFEQHCQEANERFDQMQERIDKKLDKIQDMLEKIK